MINALSRNLAHSLGEKLDSNETEIATYTYGIEIFLGVVIKFILIITLTSLLGILDTTLFFVLTLSVFRFIGGGVHLNTYLRCLVFGLLLAIAMGSVATINLADNVLMILFAVSFSIALFVCIKWIPAGTDKKQITNSNDRLKQKKATVIMLIFWSIFVLTCISINLHSYAMASILGLLCSSFFIMPAGYLVIGNIDKFLDGLMKGGVDNV